MSFRFFKRIKLAPGITLNLSKSGGSLSFGPRGAKFTIGPRGQRTTFGIPGTGLFYTTNVSTKGKNASRRRSRSKRNTRAAYPAGYVSPEKKLTLGFFKRLVTPKEEQDLVEACRDLYLGKEEEALEHLEQVTHLVDGAYLAGFLSLKSNHPEQAVTYLEKAMENHEELGRYLSKYGISATFNIHITDEISACLGPHVRGVLLGLVEAYQHMEQWDKAVLSLDRLIDIEPADVVVMLSFSELLLDMAGSRPGTLKDACTRIVKITQDVENESPVHTALLLYKARALRHLGLMDASREILTIALRRKKGRSDELRKALFYERSLVLQELGQKGRARKDLEKIYVMDPDYEDVAGRLGL
ncbi:MAG: DUF4236 domain-containing protein [Deltaproteobacteria bacterium]|nr:DUF4236 domain-containing protein [Deltaproteobacteria bacterium]